MFKKIRRVLCLCLVLAMLAVFLPARQAAARELNAREQELVKLIQQTYDNSRQQAGFYSFYGYCGTMVAWQLHILGITEERVKSDGRDLYDYFYRQSYTSGGYQVRPYDGGYWGMAGALNDITENGTKDAYNILVGFQSTPSEAGSMYGHSVLIFGIIDGVVYYNESSMAVLDGVYYPEGAARSCSVNTFISRYSYATLDGLIYFGRNTYDESCTQYPAYLYAGATEDTLLYSQPCTTETDERSNPLRTVRSGEQLSVVGLYENTLGEFWYQVESKTEVGYILADCTKVLQMRYDDVTISDADIPWELRLGRNYRVAGEIKSTNNRICTVRAQLFLMDGTEATHVLSATEAVDARRFHLLYSDLTEDLKLPWLDAGIYRLELAAVVGNYYYADGELQTQWETVRLWRSEFAMVTRYYTTNCVIFDAEGGWSSMNEANVYIGQPLAQMPEAVRPGYVFLGWYTADGTQITEDTVIPGDITLYAHWAQDENANGWYYMDGSWSYLTNGVPQTGFQEAEGITYYIQEDGSFATGLQRIGSSTYYFQPNGALHLGWLKLASGTCYFTENGMVTGWMEIDGTSYYFDEVGILKNER